MNVHVNHVSELYKKIVFGLNDRMKINFEGATYSFNQTYTKEDSIAQAVKKHKLTALILERYYAHMIKQDLFKGICLLEHEDCDGCYLKVPEVIHLIQNILTNIDKPKGNITYIQPTNIDDGLKGCFYFNHLTDEEQAITIIGLNKHDKNVFIYPCNDRKCYAEQPNNENDEDLDFFSKFKGYPLKHK